MFPVLAFLLASSLALPTPPVVLWNTSLPQSFTADLQGWFFNDDTTLVLWSRSSIVAVSTPTGGVIWQSTPKYGIFFGSPGVFFTYIPDTVSAHLIRAIQPITEKVLFTTTLPSNSGVAGGALSGDVFALSLAIPDIGQPIMAYSAVTGKYLWTHTPVAKVRSMSPCSKKHFCVTLENQKIAFLDGQTGKARWHHQGLGVANHDTPEDRVVIGDGSFLNQSLVYLVDSNTGKDLWTSYLGNGNHGWDWSINGDHVYVSYLQVGSKRNSYPGLIAALQKSTGKLLYSAKPHGSTMGVPAFFDNGDFTALGDQMVARYNGQNGMPVCALSNIKAYDLVTPPIVQGRFWYAAVYKWDMSSFSILKRAC